MKAMKAMKPSQRSEIEHDCWIPLYLFHKRFEHHMINQIYCISISSGKRLSAANVSQTKQTPTENCRQLNSMEGHRNYMHFGFFKPLNALNF